MTRKRPTAPPLELGRRPKVDFVEILVAEEPFERGGRGMVTSVGTLAVTIRVEREPTQRGTLIGANLKGRLRWAYSGLDEGFPQS